ncbi:MAG: LD-carboxypeptidase [Erysipelotrichaceae bacterium]|nr:LD-carboxypeptidase [Erysipelotrichaceae bacterium]
MRYPNFLKPNDTIGLIAPSFGISGEPYTSKFISGKQKFVELGYNFKEGTNIYQIEKARSASAKVRAKDFMDMYLDPDVDMIFSVAGGELMVEILPFIDFELIKNSKPKFFMGYSDNTNLTFLLTILCDIATIYGPHLTEFGMTKWDDSIKESYQIITGNLLEQYSYPFYQTDDISQTVGHYLDSFNMLKPVKYHSLYDKNVNVSGRLIGGCLDVIMSFCGIYDQAIAEFKKRYHNDGIIWYLEACDLNPLMMLRSLLQLKLLGYFDDCKAILFGRSFHDEKVIFDISFDEAIHDALNDLNIPIITNMDIGHLPPTFTIINGSYVTVEVIDQKGKISYQLK